jgi:SAM-dependent methyltransferase
MNYEQLTYNEEYYERGIELGISGYSNYRWMPELTIPMCYEMINILNIKDDETILDFGCAKGYVVKGFRLLHKLAYGVDISEYAILSAPNDIKHYLYRIESEKDIPLQNNKKYDYTIAKDVLEHIPYEHLDSVLLQLRKITNKLFIVVPLGENKKYIIPSYEQDTTHHIRESIDWWEYKLLNVGFTTVYKDYKIKHIKSNWSKWEKGNGFFVLQ